MVRAFETNTLSQDSSKKRRTNNPSAMEAVVVPTKAVQDDPVGLGEAPVAPSGRIERKIARRRFRRVLNVIALRPKQPKHPQAQPIDPRQHVVWLFDNIAYQPIDLLPEDSKTWEAEIVACVFGREHRNTGQYVARIADFLGIDGKFGEDPLIRQRIAQRLKSLLYVVAPNRTLPVNMDLPNGQVQRFDLGPTDRNGVLSQTISFQQPEIADGTVTTSQLTASNGDVVMKTRFTSPEGWLLISDVDDSIKITLTSDTVGILRSTFVSDPEPIAGMPEFYQHIEQELKPACVYLSASPYNLYGFLRTFIHSFYPPGTLMLRETSWKDLGEFAKSYNTGTQTYKMRQVDKVHTWLPARKVICVGDSTQKDPEVYAEMYRKHEGWIQAIFIRKATGIPHMNKRNSDERFQAAFTGISNNVWRVFEDPRDLYESITRMKLETTVVQSPHVA